MAVPKRRTSRARTHMRRSQWKAAGIDLVPIVVDSETRLVPRRLMAYYHRFPDRLDARQETAACLHTAR